LVRRPSPSRSSKTIHPNCQPIFSAHRSWVTLEQSVTRRFRLMASERAKWSVLSSSFVIEVNLVSRIHPAKLGTAMPASIAATAITTSVSVKENPDDRHMPPLRTLRAPLASVSHNAST
jgi:hypothetical protein